MVTFVGKNDWAYIINPATKYRTFQSKPVRS